MLQLDTLSVEHRFEILDRDRPWVQRVEVAGSLEPAGDVNEHPPPSNAVISELVDAEPHRAVGWILGAPTPIAVFSAAHMIEGIPLG